MVEAIRIIGWTDPGGQLPALQATLESTNVSSVRMAALEAIGRAKGTEVTDLLVQIWPELLPSERAKAIQIFLQNDPRRLVLLKQIAEQYIQPASLSWPQKVSLLNSAHPEVREQARRLLQGSELSADAVWATYESCLSMPGNAEKGRLLFEQHCGICHQLGGQHGIAFGPDLASVQNRNKAALLLDILQPNRSIADGYELWSITLQSGQPLVGVIVQESPTSLTVRTATGEEQTVARENIQRIQASEVSAMPEQLHQQLGVEEMADLLVFLKGG